MSIWGVVLLLFSGASGHGRSGTNSTTKQTMQVERLDCLATQVDNSTLCELSGRECACVCACVLLLDSQSTRTSFMTVRSNLTSLSLSIRTMIENSTAILFLLGNRGAVPVLCAVGSDEWAERWDENE
jgi:hypothetical protein